MSTLPPGERVLEAGGIAIPLLETPQGIFADPGTHSDIVPIAWVLNAAQREGVPDLRERLARGEDVESAGLTLRHVEDPASEPDLARAWRRLSGRDPEGDAYVISGEHFIERQLVPVATLRDLLHAFDTLPAVSIDRDAAGLDALEGLAADVERLEAAGEIAAAAQKRRLLLLELQERGWFDLGRALVTAALLRAGDWPLLAGYRSAGLRVAAYLRSPQRAEFLPDSDPHELPVGSRVSLDWFRFENPLPYDDDHPFQWLAFCEHVFARADVSGGAGRVLAKSEDRWYELQWRLDDAIHPALVSARPYG